MPVYILLSKHQSNLRDTDEALSVMSERLMRKVDAECDGVTWTSGYAVLGPHDYLDIFEAPDNEAAAKVAFIVRSNTDVETEVWAATPREVFEDMVGGIESGRTSGVRAAATSSDAEVNGVEEADRESFPASDPPSYTGTSTS
jgi:uncharacterized protein with GYD domain